MPVTEWNGPEISAQILAASVEAIDELTGEAADLAEHDHWWTNRTDQLEQETISEPARAYVHVAVGRFGTTRRRGFYGLILEYKRPFLRPIADSVFPQLAARIRGRL